MVGFNAKNKIILDKRFICSICSLIIRDSIQLTECGHRLCRSCCETFHETTIKCPECLKETPFNRIMVDQGFRNDMQPLPIECFLCYWTGQLYQYQDHLQRDHQNPTCQYCNQQCTSVDDLSEHQVLRCEQRIVQCLLKDFGCNEHIPFFNMSDHYTSEQHRYSLRKYSLQMQLQMENERKSSAQRGTDLSHSTDVVAVDLDAAVFRELCETLSVLFDDEEILRNDGQRRLNNALLLCQKKFPTLKPNFFRSNVSVEEMTPNQEILRQNIASLQQKVEDSQSVSYDGSLIWKISNVAEKMADAQSERQTSIYSPPFCSSPIGYKMRARLYLYGDGNARRTHMSLFFVLMRSEFDAILKFPFNYRVTFCLYDQTSARRHIIDSFRPDVKSNSFQRPQSDMNTSNGIPKFFPLSMIQQEGNSYVRNDTMFIRIMVDVGDMPKTLLPYALSLNPGLPLHIQQAMIRQESERRVRQLGKADQAEEEEN